MGIFVGYAGYYLVRKNFTLAMPYLVDLGYSKTGLGLALSGVSISYGLSKFIMGNVSDRSNARTFMALGLICSSAVMIFVDDSCSIWQWASMPPGRTSMPCASISRSPEPRSKPIAAIRSSRMPISAMNVSTAVAIVPPLIRRSKSAMASGP